MALTWEELMRRNAVKVAEAPLMPIADVRYIGMNYIGGIE